MTGATAGAGTGGWSLRRRLLGWLLVATAILGLLALLDTWGEALRTAQGVSDRVLGGSAMAIAERVSVDLTGGIEVDIPYSALEMLASTAEDQVFYRVDGPAGFITGYDRLEVLRAQDGLAFRDSSFDGTPVRIATLARQVSTGEGWLPFTVTVAESTRARDALARAILWRSALRLLGMILGAALIVWITVTLALRPLDRLGETIADRSPDDLTPLAAQVPDEVAGLVGSVNSFMQRLGQALGALRNFTGNASHQLRTPLATVRAQLGLLRDGVTPDGLDKADAALARAERVLAQLLMLARIDAAAAHQALPEVDIAAIARGLAGDLIPEAARHGHDLGFEGADRLMAQADPVLCAELLRNLAENAMAYAGPAATITLRALQTPQGPVLEVEDDGPGIPPDRLADLMARRATRVDSAQQLHGLGLAVVSEIAGLFGARLEFQPGAGGRGQLVRCRFG
ncbi:sensor histidine kinase [Gemmobacter denitrificans]|uniref:histidine kinase n=1 Tax=Gemmobacter denitrificans TaxID=3123040 RepID=A0ABU8BZT2_9RHOB